NIVPYSYDRNADSLMSVTVQTYDANSGLTKRRFLSDIRLEGFEVNPSACRVDGPYHLFNGTIHEASATIKGTKEVLVEMTLALRNRYKADPYVIGFQVEDPIYVGSRIGLLEKLKKGVKKQPEDHKKLEIRRQVA
ncbi:MAG: hypothetical protein QW331_04150, partial [Candidatus Woesearchaeota archaeon]